MATFKKTATLSKIGQIVKRDKLAAKRFKGTLKKMAQKQLPPHKIKNYIEAYIKTTAKRANLRGIAQVIATWGATELGVRVGNTYAKAIEAPPLELAGSASVVPMLESDQMRRLTGANQRTFSKMHVTNIDTGQAPTRSNLAMSRLYGTTTKNHVDTIRTVQTDINRASMTVGCGFNQKVQWVFNPTLTGYTIGELATIFDIADSDILEH